MAVPHNADDAAVVGLAVAVGVDPGSARVIAPVDGGRGDGRPEAGAGRQRAHHEAVYVVGVAPPPAVVGLAVAVEVDPGPATLSSRGHPRGQARDARAVAGGVEGSN